jgi:hypothetical protein
MGSFSRVTLTRCPRVTLALNQGSKIPRNGWFSKVQKRNAGRRRSPAISLGRQLVEPFLRLRPTPQPKLARNIENQ